MVNIELLFAKNKVSEKYKKIKTIGRSALS